MAIHQVLFNIFEFKRKEKTHYGCQFTGGSSTEWQVLNHPNFPEFSWCTKNMLWDELNVLNRSWLARPNRALIITETNQACLSKMKSCDYKEGGQHEITSINADLLGFQKREYLAKTRSQQSGAPNAGMVCIVIRTVSTK
jgi:hypothetical protein